MGPASAGPFFCKFLETSVYNIRVFRCFDGEKVSEKRN